MNSTRLFVSWLLCFSLLSCSKKAAQLVVSKVDSNKEHNVILILVDDLGWTDVSYNGSKFYETPNLDELSSNSFVFTNAYSSGSVCSPSRAALLTGRHPVRVGITDWLQGQNPKDRKFVGAEDLQQLPLEEITIAELLKQKGYKTFFSGKWHLGGEGYLPEDQGFDINIGGHEKGSPPGGYYAPYNNPKILDGPDGEYLTDRLTDESISFLDGVGQDPFFLMLSYYTVHTPIQASEKHLTKFEKKLSMMPDSTIQTREEGKGVTVLNQLDPAYASMVYAMDENIGRLISKLKAMGIYDSSTLIFTSDNGGLSTLEKRYNKNAPTAVTPLRGGKGWLYEGGIRVPLLIKPAMVSVTATEINEPVIGHDLLPTICSLTDTPLPEGVVIDGFNLTPLMNGSDALDREYLYWHYPHYHGSAWTPGAAIRKGNWKVIEFYDERVELYNLKNDISESTEVSIKQPLELLDLRMKLMNLQKEMHAKWHTENPTYSK